MSFNIVVTPHFERKLKRLAKKYDSLIKDLDYVIDELSENPLMGVPIGKDCYKIRIAISSKGRGKSGGARLITYIQIVRSSVFLVEIYDKSEQTTLTDKEVRMLIDAINED